MAGKVSWIAADWGTSRLRLFAAAADGRLLETRESDEGMAVLAPRDFEPTLLELSDDWLCDAPMPVIACGMVGARQAWVEVPYRTVPLLLADLKPVDIRANAPRLAVSIVPGLAQNDPPDVMRGEETQLVGLTTLMPDFSGVVCLPGTHTKWCWVSEGRLQRFTTRMSGELYGLLTEHGVLRHAVDDGWREACFEDAVIEAAASKGDLLKSLFSVRAKSLLQYTLPGEAAARLSGLVVGAEIAAMRAEIGDLPLMLVGGSGHTARYHAAMACLGLPAETIDGSHAVRTGLAKLSGRVSIETMELL